MSDLVFVQIKPMTVNRAWQGKRFKTPEYKAYEQELLLRLPPCEVPDGEFCVILEWGLSNYSQSDWDNPIKPVMDILQKKYGFDDNRIHRAFVSKVKVPKGQEYLTFSFHKHIAIVGTD